MIALALSVVASSSAPAAPKAPAASFPGGPHFVLSCGFTHRNNDDPIRFPDQPGLSHNHTYIGAFVVDASTTPGSLLGGRSSCDFGADSSAYWAPTFYQGRRAIKPLAGFVYYIKRTRGSIVAFPAGLKMIAGNAMARKPQSPAIASWSCSDELGQGRRYAVVPTCARDHVIEIRITFPNCWNGTSLDSPSHQSHMAYSVAAACPTSHPVAVPTLVLILLYPQSSPRAQVASGRFATHADFMNGWAQAALAQLVASLNQSS
jgi:hypothetical protein